VGILLIGMLTGCTQNIPDNVSETAPPTDTTAPTETEAPTETPALRSEITIEPDNNPYAGWYRYTRLDYGFSFAFPPEWEVAGEHENGISINPQADPDFQLGIRFRSIEERLNIVLSGMPAGDFVLAGEVSFFGQETEKHHLVYEEKNKKVLYNYACGTDVEYMIFSLDLGYYPDRLGDYEDFEIPVEFENTADRIVESFAFVESPMHVSETAIAHTISATETQTSLSLQTRSTLEPDDSPFAGWYRYTDMDYSFSFAFPADWDEIQDLIYTLGPQIHQPWLHIGPLIYPWVM